MSDMAAAQAKKLRDPFLPKQIGKLPKSTCRACSQSQRKRCDDHRWVSNCPECHGSHTSATIHLDYVGHAATTDRLLTVDPTWSWEPFAVGPDGLPALDRSNNLWIKLTVCGVTRIGVGDGKSAKECIGDAIRNAAMRFGVALDLWAKEDIHDVGQEQSAPAPQAPPPPPEDDPWQPAIDASESPLLDTRSNLAKSMFAALNKAGIPEEERLEQTGLIIGRAITSSKEMTEAEARRVLDHLKAQGATT